MFNKRSFRYGSNKSPVDTVLSVIMGIIGWISFIFMLASSIMWFRCMSEILTSDKIVYLFGKTFPILGLVLSMVLGFVPKLQRNFSEINRCRGNHVIYNLSILITWALDDAMLVADSMKGRGYGLEGRTSYTIYRFTKQDGWKIGLMLLALFYIVLGNINGGLGWNYYPKTEGSGFQLYSISIYLVYGWICILPVLEDYWKERTWNKLQSNI